MSAKRVQLGKAGITLLALCVGLGAERDARATLGGDMASVAANEQTLRAVRTISVLSVGERHDLALPSGVVIREYLASGGAVYAVTWSGPRVPNLQELLGPHFADLAKRAPQGGHNRMSLTGDDFEVRSAGHRHYFAGRAWIPSLVPTGVNLDTVLE
jgi:hypothetical protein